MLIRILQGKRLIRKRLVLEPEVVERASTAPPSRPLRRIASR
jgi:hypothetical protein